MFCASSCRISGSALVVLVVSVTVGSGEFCAIAPGSVAVATRVNEGVYVGVTGSTGVPVAVRLGVVDGLAVLDAVGLSVATGVRVGEGVSEAEAETVVSGDGKAAVSVSSAARVLVTWPGSPAGSLVFVGGCAVGAEAEMATKLALSQYMSLCLLENSGLVRINTVIILPWALPSTLTCPH